MPCGFNSNTNLFWLGHSKDPRPHLSELLNKNYACYIGGCDFDRVMIEIARGTDCWPPKILENPPSHVLQQLAPLPDFPVGVDSGVAVLGDLRRRLNEAASVWQDETPEEGRTEEAFLAGEDIDADIDRSSLSGEARSVLAWRFVEQGVALSKEANVLTGSEQRAEFAKAYEKYAEALEIKPDLHEALNNWGAALSEEAQVLTGSEQRAKFAKAYEKFAAALEIKPDMHEALYNWGNALSEEAKVLTGSEQRAKFAKAYEKFAAALELKPDMYEALYNWGNALSEEAKVLTGSQQRAKFAKAYEKYAAALEVKPVMHEALYNWGSALSEEAAVLTGSDQRAKYTQAYEKFAAALEVKPDMQEALNNWSSALLYQCAGLDGAARQEVLKSAEEKLLRAKELSGQPDYNLACLFAVTDQVDAALEELEACEKAGTLPERGKAHLEEDTDMDALRDHPRFKALLERAA